MTQPTRLFLAAVVALVSVLALAQAPATTTVYSAQTAPVYLQRGNDGFTIQPGYNTLPLAVWCNLRQHPTVQLLLSLNQGGLVEMQPLGCPSADTGGGAVGDGGTQIVRFPEGYSVPVSPQGLPWAVSMSAPVQLAVPDAGLLVRFEVPDAGMPMSLAAPLVVAWPEAVTVRAPEGEDIPVSLRVLPPVEVLVPDGGLPVVLPSPVTVAAPAGGLPVALGALPPVQLAPGGVVGLAVPDGGVPVAVGSLPPVQLAAGGAVGLVVPDGGLPVALPGPVQISTPGGGLPVAVASLPPVQLAPGGVVGLVVPDAGLPVVLPGPVQLAAGTVVSLAAVDGGLPVQVLGRPVVQMDSASQAALRSEVCAAGRTVRTTLTGLAYVPPLLADGGYAPAPGRTAVRLRNVDEAGARVSCDVVMADGGTPTCTSPGFGERLFPRGDGVRFPVGGTPVACLPCAASAELTYSEESCP